jgi:glycogen(starch) synthase
MPAIRDEMIGPHPDAGFHPRAKARVGTVLMTADAVGGVWRYSLDLARALRPEGIRTVVAVMGPSPSPAQRSEAAEAGVALVDRPYRLEWMDEPWSDVERAGRWLLALARVLRPDIIHLNGYAHAQLPWPAPVVVVAHSCVRTWWKAVKCEDLPRHWARYSREVAGGLLAATVVVAPTAAMLNAIRDEYRVPLRSRVIPNGSVPGTGWPGFDAKEPCILSVGRVWDDAKNIRALAAVADRVPWPVIVAGECRPPLGAALELRGARLLGSLCAADLADWYRRAAIYALPARYEPFGLSVLEAANAACALVLGDIPSLRENWNDAALFVPPGDDRALVAAIRRLIDEPAVREALARRAFARASALSVERTADAYCRLYHSLAS